MRNKLCLGYKDVIVIAVTEFWVSKIVKHCLKDMCSVLPLGNVDCHGKIALMYSNLLSWRHMESDMGV
ncbi:hypothetical protein LWI29_038216 [Acer saccharum]|uniref:Uncharacterized protein n=1 Tax=Acer saccharum TaxID=4024 RepID=A0AA39RPL5_ACESA|nr:hypothetical protein LWI29_038216 [Acer saccharum]